MPATTKIWDYLIVTAANDQQAEAYEIQIRRRHQAGELPQVRNCLVIADIDGKRIGSGGSTLHCLASVLRKERSGAGALSFEEAETILRRLRILIVHAGGDSRRLPAYCHCGKIFVPVPVKGQPSVASTLFDRLVPAFFALPETPQGQVVIASGDALILFDPLIVNLGRPGITALGSFAPAKEASHHGVFCANRDGSVRRFLQKPSPQAQAAAGAMHDGGDSVLDIGVMSCDAGAAVQLMRAFLTAGGEQPDSAETGEPGLLWKTDSSRALYSKGIDLYREICCALGTETTLEQYADSVRASGSSIDGELLAQWFGFLHQIPFNLDILPRCKFLHFGTTRQLITSGLALLAEDSGQPAKTCLILNSAIESAIAGDHLWIEGCCVKGGLALEGFNALVGLDLAEPLSLRKGACLDMSAGSGRKGEKVWFLRYYDIDDTFKHSAQAGGTFCGLPLGNWMDAVGASVADIWPPELQEGERTLWNARVFPAIQEHQNFCDWLWLLQVQSANAKQKNSFLAADRYSSSEIAVRVDQAQFHARRCGIRPAPMPLGSGARTSAPACIAVDNV